MYNDYQEEQRKEIRSIRPRTIKIELSDADVERLYKKAASVSLSPERLIEHFVGDLVCGTYTNGSDERDFISQWLHRCEFGMWPDRTLIKYLSDEEILDDFISDFEAVKAYERELIDLKERLKEAQDTEDKNDLLEEIEACKEDISYNRESVLSVWNSFLEYSKKDLDLASEYQKVVEWRNARDRAINGEYGCEGVPQKEARKKQGNSR